MINIPVGKKLHKAFPIPVFNTGENAYSNAVLDTRVAGARRVSGEESILKMKTSYGEMSLSDYVEKHLSHREALEEKKMRGNELTSMEDSILEMLNDKLDILMRRPLSDQEAELQTSLKKAKRLLYRLNK